VVAVMVLLSTSAGAAPSKYDAAVKLLENADTWCTGAKRLAALKDKRAVLPLVRPFLEGSEADKMCLYDALEDLGAATEARPLMLSSNPKVRAAAIELMLLFGSDDQLAPLSAEAQGDPEVSLRARALDVLRQQRRTPKWQQTVADLLASTDDSTRGWAILTMIDDGRDGFKQRLKAHLPHEKNANLRAKIQGALASPRG
jgi:hypothetical protein